MYRIRYVTGVGKKSCFNAHYTSTHANTGAQFAVVKRWTSSLDKIYPRHDSFVERHIGPNEVEKKAMLDFIGMKVSGNAFSYFVALFRLLIFIVYVLYAYEVYYVGRYGSVVS